MKRVRIMIETGYVGADYEDVFEVEDDATEDDIWDIAEDYLHEKVEVTWEFEEE